MWHIRYKSREATPRNKKINHGLFFSDKIVYPLICDEDHRVRSAVASCVVALVRTWADAESSAASVRVQRLSGGGGGAEDAACGDLRTPTVSGVAVPVSGLAECFQDVERDERLTPTLTFFVDQLLQWLATSNSKFTKVGRRNSV